MKSATKIISAILAIWYCMSIIGFDVHTCSYSGRSFVATFMTGLTCSDIHPEHTCSHLHCCGEHVSDHSCCMSGETVSSSSCCTNDFQVLLLTGISGQEDNRHYDVSICGNSSFIDLMPSEAKTDNFHKALLRAGYLFGHGLPDSGNVRSFLGIWRI